MPVGMIAALTFASLAIHGYHPYAEDGGLYAAGIKRLLNPALYPYSADFVDAHLRFSLFAPAVAGVVRTSHLPLTMVLLSAYLICIAATLTGVWLLAKRCYRSTAAHVGATMLTATWLTIPVAGTSLILVDPYLTARSISLPCSLFALVAIIDLFRSSSVRGKAVSATLCAFLLLLAALAHPLMAAYALGDVLLLCATMSGNVRIRRGGVVTLCLTAVVAAGLLQAFSPPESSAYVQVAITRYYWFLSRWQWYEIVGLVAPLIILAAVARRTEAAPQAFASGVTRCALARVALTSGLTALTIALMFAHESSAAHLVARLQPLRAFQTIYLLMVLVLGAVLGEHVLRRKLWRWVVVFTFSGSVMFYVQRNTYPSSEHIEWREGQSANQWQEAFHWIRSYTPTDALFALDAHYISQPGEDAQSFRAIAERSTLPDYSKDGGEASITPSLTSEWTQGQFAQHNLDGESDAQRVHALRPFNVGWIVLQQHTQTTFFCPYQNSLEKVCHLP